MEAAERTLTTRGFISSVKAFRSFRSDGRAGRRRAGPGMYYVGWQIMLCGGGLEASVARRDRRSHPFSAPLCPYYRTTVGPLDAPLRPTSY